MSYKVLITEEIDVKGKNYLKENGFKIKEIVIKEQHNCKATGYWKTNSIKYNFMLLAHEYLFIFIKS